MVKPGGKKSSSQPVNLYRAQPSKKPDYSLQLKAFVQKGCVQLFGPIFIFLPDWANPWQTDLCWHEKHNCTIVFVDPHFASEKQCMQKNQFSKGIFWRSFVERKTKETFCFAKRWSHRSVAFAPSFIIHIITLPSNYWESLDQFYV